MWASRSGPRVGAVHGVAAPPDLPARLGRDPRAGVALAAELVARLVELDGVAGCHLSLIGGDPGAPLAVLERLR
jgi:hypothetical protein